MVWGDIMLDNRQTIGNYLKFIRAEKGVSPERIQLQTDIPPKEYLQYEEGKLPIDKDTLKLLSRVFPIPRKYKQLADDPKKSTFANRITQLRISNDRSQAETANLLEIAQTTYAGYETGKHEPDMKMLIKIANLYNVSIDYVVGRY